MNLERNIGRFHNVNRQKQIAVLIFANSGVGTFAFFSSVSFAFGDGFCVGGVFQGIQGRIKLGIFLINVQLVASVFVSDFFLAFAQIGFACGAVVAEIFGNFNSLPDMAFEDIANLFGGMCPVLGKFLQVQFHKGLACSVVCCFRYHKILRIS